MATSCDSPLSTPVTTAASILQEDELAIFACMAVNDSALTPKPFQGTESDSEKTEQWIDYFHTYTDFRQITGNSKLQLFRLLMADKAADWLRSLETPVQSDFDTLDPFCVSSTVFYC